MKGIPIYLLLLLLLQGCIKDDLSDCESWLLLKFRYTLNDQYANLFDAEVQQVTVYLFDAEGKYVDCFSEQGEQLTNDYVMRIPLPAGEYTVVVYGGDFTTYSVGGIGPGLTALNTSLQKGVTDIADFRAELNHITGAGDYLYPAATPDDLYAGWAAGAVSSVGNERVTEVDLMKDTKKIKVRISAADAASFAVSITALNGRYGFDNQIDPDHGTFLYTPVGTLVQPGYLEVDLKILRLMLGQSSMLSIKNSATAEVVYHENLISQILQTGKYLTQEDFDREDEFIFDLLIPSGDHSVGISVTINGWKIEAITPDDI